MARLSALRDFINDLMQKKETYDWKCMQGGQPLATLERFLFIHLSEKYGLKNLVESQAHQIIESVRVFMKQDALVLFFAKALKNMCPTGYRGTMVLREAQITQLMHSILHERFKTHLEVNRSMESLKENKIQLSQVAWTKCAKALFSDNPLHCREFLAQLKACKHLKALDLSGQPEQNESACTAGDAHSFNPSVAKQATRSRNWNSSTNSYFISPRNATISSTRKTT